MKVFLFMQFSGKHRFSLSQIIAVIIGERRGHVNLEVIYDCPEPFILKYNDIRITLDKNINRIYNLGLSSMGYIKSWQMFSVKGQIVNIVYFVGLMVSVTVQACHCSIKQAQITCK